MEQCYCKTCRQTMNASEFYSSYNLEKYPNGKLNECKKCATMLVDNFDPETFKPLLKEIDVPYIKTQWDSLLKKYENDLEALTGKTILGKYLSKMRLSQWKTARWADTERIEAEIEEKRIQTMRDSGLSEDEIQVELAQDKELIKAPGWISLVEEESAQLPISGKEDPNSSDSGTSSLFPSVQEILEEEKNLGLTEEDTTYLRIKWGTSYRPSEWVQLEQFYNDMMASYDIQTAGHKDTLIKLCKTSLKANQLLDAGDIDNFQKMLKAYDTLMKSGKFTAVQNKAEQGEFIDAVGELVVLCEQDGYIPKYYVDKPKDKVDRVIEDTQHYVHTLVTEEMGLGNLIENAIRQLEDERQTIKEAGELGYDENDEVMAEEHLFDYKDSYHELRTEDFQEFYEEEEKMSEEDMEYLHELAIKGEI